MSKQRRPKPLRERLLALLESKIREAESTSSQSLKKSLRTLFEYCTPKEEGSTKPFTLFNDLRYSNQSFISLLRHELITVLTESLQDTQEIEESAAIHISVVLFGIEEGPYWSESKFRKTDKHYVLFINGVRDSYSWITSYNSCSAGSRLSQISDDIYIISELLGGVKAIIETSEMNGVKICKYCYRITYKSKLNDCCKNHKTIERPNKPQYTTNYIRGKRAYNRIKEHHKKLTRYQILREYYGDNIQLQSSFHPVNDLKEGCIITNAELHELVDEIQRCDWSPSIKKNLRKYLVKFTNIFPQLEPHIIGSDSYEEFRKACLSPSILDHEEDPSNHPFWLLESIQLADVLMKPKKKNKK
ncbi:hypothetical protein [Marinomonas transparens]|uniref:Uncharacterized protein n=1 Tax=Marinomonas transparens TaxID=2795388 RepID=A0A934JJZ1_9GAMM|nr:hypothetical protein [Marinomonas transparens]MBJ7537196.1 hypothetical protein [Marinomonas transparens]